MDYEEGLQREKHTLWQLLTPLVYLLIKANYIYIYILRSLVVTLAQPVLFCFLVLNICIFVTATESMQTAALWIKRLQRLHGKEL